jgi:hypothetical protein
MGVPPHSRRGGRARHHGSGVDGMADPEERGDRSGAAPGRAGPGWPEFLRSQAQGILALDFFTADLLNGAKFYVLVVIELGTRRVRVLGATEHPVQAWVVQQARNLRAPRGALLYRPRSGQGLEEVSLDLMADP